MFYCFCDGAGVGVGRVTRVTSVWEGRKTAGGAGMSLCADFLVGEGLGEFGGDVRGMRRFRVWRGEKGGGEDGEWFRRGGDARGAWRAGDGV